MPIPFMAAASSVAVDSKHQQQQQVYHNPSQHEQGAPNHDGNDDDVDDATICSFHKGEDTQSISSVRSVDYNSPSQTSLRMRGMEHKTSSSHRHPFLSRVELSTNTLDPDVETNHSTMYCNSYIDASFHSGLMARIAIPDGCFVLATGPERSSLMAVGTLGAIQLYSVSTLVLVATITLTTTMGSHAAAASTRSMVSALAWLESPADDGNDDSDGQYTLVATTLQGHVSVYRVNPELLEVEGEGIQTLPGATWTLDTQVRSVQAVTTTTPSSQQGSVAVAAVGDAEGCLHLFSWPTGTGGESSCMGFTDTIATSVTHVCIPITSTAILQVAWDASATHIAIATHDGAVQVHRVVRGKSATSSTVVTTEIVWSTTRAGPVHALAWQGSMLVLGGYDRTCVLVDTNVWGIAREIILEGSINALSFDPLNRYLAVGCRDKSLTLLDSSTWQPIKSWGTTGWVTSISWFATDRMVLRSERTRLSVLDLTPTQYFFTNHRLVAPTTSSTVGFVAGAWLDTNRFIRTVNNSLLVADTTRSDLETLSSWSTPSPVQRMALDPRSNGSRLAAVDAVGRLCLWDIQQGQMTWSSFLEPGLRALEWSRGGKLVVTGGKKKLLHVWNACEDGSLEKVTNEPVDMSGRIWDLAFCPGDDLLAVALGDYTAVLLDTETWTPTLQITRSRTVRCCSFHPKQPLLVVGDGAGTVCIIDYAEGDILYEFDAGDRVNTVVYSPQGDYLIVGSDASCFTMHHSSTYHCVQEFESNSFATTASFSPGGTHLVLGSDDASYGVVRLGPFLGMDQVPLTLQDGISELPPWALAQVLYRSVNGPSFVQRHMTKGGPDNLRRVATILQQYPGALYAYNRQTGDTFFHTALDLKKPNLLKLVVTAMVNGSLDRIDERSSVLTTPYPALGRQALGDIVDNYSSELLGDIFQAMTFIKVPFAEQRVGVARRERASKDFRDPWSKRSVGEDWQERDREDVVDSNVSKATSLAPKESLYMSGEPLLTPAVLPLPGLGEMDFLLALLSHAQGDVWGSEAMGLVLTVMWKDHIRKYFIVDFALYLVLCTCWISLIEAELVSSNLPDLTDIGVDALNYSVFLLNSLFALKEIVQSRYGRRGLGYFKSFWNAVDILAVVFMYAYILYRSFNEDKSASIPLAVVSTLMSTMKLLSYLRGFGQTGWLISVLGANFWDIRGFLVILFTILGGFAVAFRLLFASISDEAFGSLRRSFLSTFELSIVGSYEPDLLYNSEQSALAIFTFILAITCCLVVTLNALISLLSDSYARIMENATANRRRERAGLVVEYMSLLPPSQRHSIEAQTQWFHTLLESDSDGELILNRNDWEGGLNALRKDMADLDEASRRNQEKLLHQLKTDMETDLGSFRKQVVRILEDLQDEVKEMKRHQTNGAMNFRGKRVKNVVKAVKTSLFTRESSA